MGERKGPKSKVRGSVGDAAQGELDGVDGLVHHHIAKVEVVTRPRGMPPTSRCIVLVVHHVCTVFLQICVHTLNKRGNKVA